MIFLSVRGSHSQATIIIQILAGREKQSVFLALHVEDVWNQASILEEGALARAPMAAKIELRPPSSGMSLQLK